MKIFCDESGGFGGKEHSFLVSAVRMPDHEAGRLMKRLRKTSDVRDEIKGTSLTEKQRVTFFDMLREIDPVSAVVTCQKTSVLGSIAKSRPGHEVFEDLLVEACGRLIDLDAPVRIMADGGRYKKTIHGQLAINAAERLTRAGLAAAIVDFGRSEKMAGIQVADIIANTVYKASPGGVFDPTSPYGRLVQSANIVVLPAILPSVRPAWMKIAAE